jgi:hypothetical protein
VPEDVEAAGDTRRRAVPEADRSVEAVVREEVDQLAAGDRGRGEFFVDALAEVDVCLGERRASGPQHGVEARERRAGVARHVGADTPSRKTIAPGLLQQQPDQRGQTREVDAPSVACQRIRCGRIRRVSPAHTSVYRPRRVGTDGVGRPAHTGSREAARLRRPIPMTLESGIPRAPSPAELPLCRYPPDRPHLPMTGGQLEQESLIRI